MENTNKEDTPRIEPNTAGIRSRLSELSENQRIKFVIR